MTPADLQPRKSQYNHQRRIFYDYKDIWFGFDEIYLFGLYAVLRGWEGRGRYLAERVVWERRAPATAHGARPVSFYAYAQTDQSNAVFTRPCVRYEHTG